MKKHSLKLVLFFLFPIVGFSQISQNGFSENPREARFHIEDIINFWKAFDATRPKFDASEFQKRYIDVGSEGLKGFIKFRIESAKKLTSTIKKNLNYYESVRNSSLSIADKKERFYECFNNLKNIYPEAVFPDVYFVIGRNNTGGTIFNKGLIIGAEKFGEENTESALSINDVDKIVAHELIHFQQKYAPGNTLLQQCIREGSADFLCKLIAGEHTNVKAHQYGDEHKAELWKEFLEKKDSNDWAGWLYSSKDKTRPKDLGYWMGYKITKAYYDKAADKSKAIREILNIQDFPAFLKESGYTGQ